MSPQSIGPNKSSVIDQLLSDEILHFGNWITLGNYVVVLYIRKRVPLHEYGKTTLPLTELPLGPLEASLAPPFSPPHTYEWQPAWLTNYNHNNHPPPPPTTLSGHQSGERDGKAILLMSPFFFILFFLPMPRATPGKMPPWTAAPAAHTMPGGVP